MWDKFKFNLFLHPRNSEHVGGAGSAERHAGGDDDTLAGPRKFVPMGNAAGLANHFAEAGDVLGLDAMHSPTESEPARRGDLRSEAEDRHLRPPGSLQSKLRQSSLRLPDLPST